MEGTIHGKEQKSVKSEYKHLVSVIYKIFTLTLPPNSELFQRQITKSQFPEIMIKYESKLQSKEKLK